jgi:hypothetical protein
MRIRDAAGDTGKKRQMNAAQGGVASVGQAQGLPLRNDAGVGAPLAGARGAGGRAVERTGRLGAGRHEACPYGMMLV